MFLLICGSGQTVFPTAALIVDIPCTVINVAKIIGRGGNGGWYTGSATTASGSATAGKTAVMQST